MLQSVFFDFGGCLDAPGIHTRTLFWDAFLAEGLERAADREAFQEAYTLADARMMRTGESAKMRLAEFNRWNAHLIGDARGIDPRGSERAGDRVTEQMRAWLADSRAALEGFRGRYALGVISNFTGNLELILEESGLRPFFQSVTESFQVGVSKPELGIFRAALAKHGHPPAACLYVGDNPVNDIAPARSLGLRTALIHPPGKRRECGADHYVSDLRELLAAIQNT